MGERSCDYVHWLVVTQSLLLVLKIVTRTACCVKTSHFVSVAKCTFRQVFQCLKKAKVTSCVSHAPWSDWLSNLKPHCTIASKKLP